MLEAINALLRPDGEASYFRLSTRPVDQGLARTPEDPLLRETRRKHVLAGGYRIPVEAPGAAVDGASLGARDEDVTLVGVGAIMPEVIAAAERLATYGVQAGVVCITSPSLLFHALHERHRVETSSRSAILDVLFPPEEPAPIVTAHDAHPHTLAFLAGVRGVPSRCLGVTEFGQGSSLSEAYELHGIDTDSIVRAALEVVGTM